MWISVLDFLHRIRQANYHYAVPERYFEGKFLSAPVPGNLTELEEAINHQAQGASPAHDYYIERRCKGLMGGDRIQATMVFEKRYLTK